jgi:tetratricopeptide (TPR) repeat protein
MKRFAALALAATALCLALPYAAAAPEAAPASASTADSVESMKPYAAASKACRDVLEIAETLSSQGKWKSAYKAIDDFDKADADPFALAMKTSLVLRGAVRSDMHRSFGLADLEEGQDLDSLRKGEGDYTPIPFDPPALADAQAANGIAPPGILSKMLGDYYYDVLGRFSGQWALSDDEILAKIAENYAKAYGVGVFDAASLLNHAEALVRLNRGDESDPIYRKAIELDPKNANVLYSYAMSLAYRGKKAEALLEVDMAIDAYGEDPSRINAIAFGARAAAELGDDAKAQAYFAIADKDYPNSPTPGILRHMIAVETGNGAAASAAADALVASFGSNPSVVRTLVSTWYSAGNTAEAREFLQRSIAKGGEDIAVATLNFYLAVLLSQGSPIDADKAVALTALDEAESRFKATLGPENEVYGAIAQIRSALQAPAPAPDATSAETPADESPADEAPVK